jgi:tRNA(Ile)-lysidine synthase
MIKLTNSLPKNITVALSGGVDSIAVTDFLSRKHNVRCVFFDHGTVASNDAFDFVIKFCTSRHIPLDVGFIQSVSPPKGISLEEHWRNERYAFFDSLDDLIVTGHNLDDCVETYLWSVLHGTPKVIPVKRNNVFRPFLTTRKQEFINWCNTKDITWLEDQSNLNTKFTRNYIRHELLPSALKVNPGLYKTVQKIVESKT